MSRDTEEPGLLFRPPFSAAEEEGLVSKGFSILVDFSTLHVPSHNAFDINQLINYMHARLCTGIRW